MFDNNIMVGCGNLRENAMFHTVRSRSAYWRAKLPFKQSSTEPRRHARVESISTTANKCKPSAEVIVTNLTNSTVQNLVNRRVHREQHLADGHSAEGRLHRLDSIIHEPLLGGPLRVDDEVAAIRLAHGLGTQNIRH